MQCHARDKPRLSRLGFYAVVMFRHVVGSDWLEYIYNVEYNKARPRLKKLRV